MKDQTSPPTWHWASLAILILAAHSAHAQSSATSISFQGALHGPNNAPLANGVYDLRFRFWDGPAPGGSAVSTNILVAAVPVTNGQVSTAIPVDAAWFNGQTRYLGVAVGGGSELLPRVLVTAVPKALNARSLVADSGEEAIFDSKGFLGINTHTPLDSLHVAPAAVQAAREVCFLTLGPGGNGVTQLSMGVRGFIDGRAEIQAFKRANVVGQEGDLLLNPGGGRVIVGENRDTDLIVFGSTRTTVLQITSARAAKEQFAPVDAAAVLAKVAALPIATWAYTNSPRIRHVGPVAEDFHAAFALGDSSQHIATVDADGVALAAIQGVNQKLEDELGKRDAEIAWLKDEVRNLRTLLEHSLATLERGVAKESPSAGAQLLSNSR